MRRLELRPALHRLTHDRRFQTRVEHGEARQEAHAVPHAVEVRELVRRDLPHFDVLAANMLGVVVSARQLILENELSEERAFDEAVGAFEEWATRMHWAEGVRE